MNKEQAHHRGSQVDPLDALLSEAFDRALSDPDNPVICERVMHRIARQQRQRTLIVGLVGAAAAVLAALGALPLIGILDNALSVFTGIGELSEGHAGLWAAALLAAGIAAGWLFLEESF
jgi:predicted tellurium resistance membrane protein TerC